MESKSKRKEQESQRVYIVKHLDGPRFLTRPRLDSLKSSLAQPHDQATARVVTSSKKSLSV